jgi:hypothetical protein
MGMALPIYIPTLAVFARGQMCGVTRFMHGSAVLVCFAIFKLHGSIAYYTWRLIHRQFSNIYGNNFFHNIERDLFKNRICFAHCTFPLSGLASKIAGCESYGLYLLAGVLLHRCATMRLIDGSMLLPLRKPAWECDCEGQGKV